MPTRRCHVVCSLAASVVAAAACHPDQWTGRPAASRSADDLTLTYREFAAARGQPGQWVTYTLSTSAANSDVLSLRTFPAADERAHDDGVAPDARAADNQYTGMFRTALHRADPQWFYKTRPPPTGSHQTPLPPDQERDHPFANRRAMAGGPGGAGDNTSLCPPGYVLTGVRVRPDAVTRTLAQVGALCRALPPEEGRAPAHRVEGIGWGEDLPGEPQLHECPPGTAVISAGRAWLGDWNAFRVLAGLELDCADFLDGGRAVVRTLRAGFPGDTGAALPFRCQEDIQPAPWPAGLRLISGARIDAIGLLCDATERDNAAGVDGLRFGARPSLDVMLDLPLRAQVTGPLFVRAAWRGRGPVVTAGRLQFPSAEAQLTLQALSTAPVDLVAPADGCQIPAADGRVVLALAPCQAPPAAWLALEAPPLRGGAAGPVKGGSLLGKLPAGRFLTVRVASTSLVPVPLAGADLPVSPLPGGGVRGGIVLMIQPAAAAAESPRVPPADP
ncbi:MAG: hypothetical protein HY904_08675 [Deltaproteobacteria bacterium]|nr:hypothetical protein [Deltaproteobacteria bacterium]